MASVERIPADNLRRGTHEIRRQGQQGQASENVGRWVCVAMLCALVCNAVADDALAQQVPQMSPVRLRVQEASPPNLAPQDGANSAPAQPEPGSPSDRMLPDQVSAETDEGTDGTSSGAADGTTLEARGRSQDTVSGIASPANSVPGSNEGPQDGLTLADVIASLYRSFPVIEQARLERARAQGEQLGAFGAFDTKLQGYSLSEPTGFYRNFQHGIGVARQTWWGGYLSAGYRVGRGDFQPWYKERETNEGGEFKLAAGVPLLQGRAIDPERVAVLQANISIQVAEPLIQQAILDFSREAAFVYWDWVAAGAMLEAQRELLQLAEDRGEQFEKGVEIELYPEIDLYFNRQLIAERAAKVLATEQKYRASGFKLSLFLRDENQQRLVPSDEWLPDHFPVIEALPPSDYDQDLRAALSQRPEPRVLRFEVQQIELERQLAANQLLPRFDMLAEASQDTGIPASSSNDKGQFELMVGFQGEVPIQRRKARGKIQETSAKIAQLTQKIRYQQDKIGAELQTAYNALMLSSEIVERAEEALRAAFDTLIRYRYAFDIGKSNLIELNIVETKTTETELKLVEAQQMWFVALAEMQAALGLDPLEQAVVVSSLPESSRPGPGFLPDMPEVDEEQLDREWEMRTDPDLRERRQRFEAELNRPEAVPPGAAQPEAALVPAVQPEISADVPDLP